MPKSSGNWNLRGFDARPIRVSPANWWGIGFRTGDKLHIRRIVSGRLLARAEKREGEHIERLSVALVKPMRSGGRVKNPWLGEKC